MSNLKKEEALEVKHVYCLSTKKYINDDAIHPYKGKCIMGIYREDFEALKEAGFPCKEFTQVVLAASDYDEAKKPGKHTVRQAMFKHIVYVDVVDHTNF